MWIRSYLLYLQMGKSDGRVDLQVDFELFVAHIAAKADLNLRFPWI
jgi:hypothetical protein